MDPGARGCRAMWILARLYIGIYLSSLPFSSCSNAQDGHMCVLLSLLDTALPDASTCVPDVDLCFTRLLAYLLDARVAPALPQRQGEQSSARERELRGASSSLVFQFQCACLIACWLKDKLIYSWLLALVRSFCSCRRDQKRPRGLRCLQVDSS